jgi:hypothetical protein
VCADCGGADHREVKVVADLPGFTVEIVEDLDVVREESDRHDNNVGNAARGELPQVVLDVGAEPGVFGAAGPALIDERPA